ncbi:spore germination protein [Bhargavaea cecembensis]|uniref:spore germination protein n=1 Tax=Bhargavaea cecembensis TaxID=394098 RepID=UPI0005903827|nr:spore germination protein [Bhargavaea cecembensis]
MSQAMLKQSLFTFFGNSADFQVKDVRVDGEKALLCFYSTMIDQGEANRQLRILEERAVSGSEDWGTGAPTEVQTFSKEKLSQAVCTGNAAVIFPDSNLMIELSVFGLPQRSPDEPGNEQVVRGSHEGFIENFMVNIGLVRKRLQREDLVYETYIPPGSHTAIHMLYLSREVAPEVLAEMRSRLNRIPRGQIFSMGQTEDYLDDTIYTPFPLFLTTERPDRVTFNLMEGKIALLADHSPSVAIAPINFFAFYESPDDYNSRPVVGSFYRLVRLAAFFLAVFLPAFYIAIISYHSEILPFEISMTLKETLLNVPYRPVFEALLLELFIELIREASVRLPQPIGQTVGIVGGIVIGDAIVSAGLASSLMVIVVAMTAIASFVIPSAEMNMAVRILRFPFMILASMFGFFGIVIGSLLLTIHLINLSSLNQPYFAPVVPYDPSRMKDVFFRLPFFKPDRQQQTFQHGEEGAE